jgi:ribosome-binding protein aMBF1 (putative translation factor)
MNDQSRFLPVVSKSTLAEASSSIDRPASVEAHTFVRESIAADLRAARESAGLTQAQLAERMGKSQTMVSQAESGAMRVSERYVRAVLKACGLPMDWGGSKPSKPRKRKGS